MVNTLMTWKLLLITLTGLCGISPARRSGRSSSRPNPFTSVRACMEVHTNAQTQHIPPLPFATQLCRATCVADERMSMKQTSQRFPAAYASHDVKTTVMKATVMKIAKLLRTCVLVHARDSNNRMRHVAHATCKPPGCLCDLQG